ncbi:MAG: peptidase [Nitrosopumilus sp.]|nr:peptidase [Nitrosopumilus sp.]MDF2422639.1 peptidase [Nitrosopumilus sp.]MDF2423873.1 peptidase [Nitrosopumilus sp.]MDF2425727.1 peptidase [Nitrosopumilus sp.]MDF2426434.1 peptidase [Nitrosopumilus sp.]
MKTTIAAISTIALLLVATSSVSSAYAEVPAWVKNNAGWWADGAITESEFISGIEFLITDGIINVPPTAVSSETSSGVPAWVKNNAGWWADGIITDGEFVNGIQHLIKSGLISVSVNSEPVQVTSVESNTEDSASDVLDADLEQCSEIRKAYDRLNCERDAKHQIIAYTYKAVSQAFEVGPVTYYWPGFDTEGNTFGITSSGQPLLHLRILVENTGSETESLFCTGPAICNYDVTNGDTSYKYSGMDFTNGQVVIKSGESKIFNMFFGPNIGGGGTTFEYDSSKEYHFRIMESFGSASIPLNLE